MNRPLQRIPEFRSEDEERAFWSAADRDSTQYLDWSRARRARFPNVKLSTQAISLRLPVSLLERIKLEANKRDVPYQSLLKIFVAERVAAEQQGPNKRSQRPAGRATQHRRALRAGGR